MTKVRNTVIVLLLVVGGLWAAGKYYVRPEKRIENCVRTNNKKMRVSLTASWGGSEPATISYLVTDQPGQEPQDFPPPDWQTFVFVRMCDLITLTVTPTTGKGTTTCSISKAGVPGRGKKVTNPRGGPVQCIHFYDKIDV